LLKDANQIQPVVVILITCSSVAHANRAGLIGWIMTIAHPVTLFKTDHVATWLDPHVGV